MLPRVKLSTAIALGLFVVPIGLLTKVAVPAPTPSPKPIAMPLIAFRPFSKPRGESGISAAAAPATGSDALTPDVYIYNRGASRYRLEYDAAGTILTGRPEAGGHGENIVFHKAIKIELMPSMPAPSGSANPIPSIYLGIDSKNKACWYVNDQSVSITPGTGALKRGGTVLLLSSTVPSNERCNK